MRRSPPSTSTGLPLLALLAVLLVLAGCAGYLYWQHNRQSSAVDTTQNSADLVTDDRIIFGGMPRAARPGITFTYLATRVNQESRMLLKDGKPSGNMFAAGEIMAGNVLGKGYAAGIGMTIGSVFGRVAGREAARNAKN